VALLDAQHSHRFCPVGRDAKPLATFQEPGPQCLAAVGADRDFVGAFAGKTHAVDRQLRAIQPRLQDAEMRQARI